MKFFLKLLGGNDGQQQQPQQPQQPQQGSSGISSAETSDLTLILNRISDVVGVALGVVAIGVVVLAVFIAYKFFTAETEDKRKNAKAQLIYAIIGIVVLLALIALKQPLVDALKNATKTTK